MAEPMSSTEIEDVLSSIRRLVAQDLKPADRARLAAVADATQKLVLAPEQRVEDGPAKFATIRRPSRRAAFPPVDAVLAGVAALTGQGGGSSARSQDSDWSLGDEAAERRAQALQDAMNEEFMDESLRADAPSAVLGRAAFGRAEFGRGDIGEASLQAQPFDVPRVVADLPPPSTSFQPAEDSDAMIALPPGYGQDDAPMPEGDFAIDPDARLFDVAPNAFSADRLAAEPAPAWVEEEADVIANEGSDDLAADAAPAREDQSLQGTIEPDADWADDAERRVIAELAGEAVEEEVFAQAKEAFREPKFSAKPQQVAPEVLFDEDVMRAMVQAIFREEMAGPMGERITRNIRKLVRAEVGRMLAAHELE